MAARSISPLDGKTIADAMSWNLLQAYVGRVTSVSAIGTELRVRFESDIEAEQMAKFIKGEPSVTDNLSQFAHEKDRSMQGSVR